MGILNLICSQEVVLLELELWTLRAIKVTLTFLFDQSSLIFLICVILIAASVIVFRYSYIAFSSTNSGFHLLVILFVVSMLILILSPNLITLILGWDGLGISSFFLVIFYKRNKSFNAGLLTALSNRVGDALILVSLALGYSFTRFALPIFSIEAINPSGFILFILMLATFTKSAQVPFRAWLPAAIAAPTPVSALVHSSTLVTAGVYVLLRLVNFLDFKYIAWILGAFGSVTILIARVSAFLESDIKKIVALSTLRQLGVIILSLSLGQISLAFFHLIVHAFFKALLFVATGNLIHNSNDYQDLRLGGGHIPALPVTKRVVVLRKLRLCGIPFFSRYYSKELILENLGDGSVSRVYVYLLIWLGVLLTSLYSLRFVFYIIGASRSNALFRKNDCDFKTILAILILFVPGTRTGQYLSLLLIESSPVPLRSLRRKLRVLSFFLLSFILFKLFTFKASLRSSKSFMYLWFLRTWRGRLPLKAIRAKGRELLWVSSFRVIDIILASWVLATSSKAIINMARPNNVFSFIFTGVLLIVIWFIF